MRRWILVFALAAAFFVSHSQTASACPSGIPRWQMKEGYNFRIPSNEEIAWGLFSMYLYRNAYLSRYAGSALGDSVNKLVAPK